MTLLVLWAPITSHADTHHAYSHSDTQREHGLFSLFVSGLKRYRIFDADYNVELKCICEASVYQHQSQGVRNRFSALFALLSTSKCSPALIELMLS